MNLLNNDAMRLCQVSRPYCLAAASFLSRETHLTASLRRTVGSSIRIRRTTPSLLVPGLSDAQSSTAAAMATSSSTIDNNDKKLTLPALIDVDCNLWHKDLQSLQQRQHDEKDHDSSCWNMLYEDAIGPANIIGMLSPSSTLTESRDGLQRLAQHPPPPIEIRTTVGVHPYHVNDDDAAWLGLSTFDDRKQALLSLLRDPSNHQWVVAVGECGLDASDGFPPITDQLPWFEFQIEVAEEFQLPLFIHERLAFTDTMRLLEKVTVPTIVHCFTGTQEECRAYVERGFYLSVSGYILKTNDEGSKEVRKCLQNGILVSFEDREDAC